MGGTGEIVKDGVNGSLLVENPSPKEIADVIEKFISLDDNTYQNFCKSAFQNWSENFNANINHPAFIHEIFNL